MRLMTDDAATYYEKLGVTKIINAAGTYTALTASTMPPSVQAAVARAAKHPVRLAELHQAAGEYLAQQLHCEAALVTSGAASGLTLGTAACMTAANRAASRQCAQPCCTTPRKLRSVARPPGSSLYDSRFR